MLTQLFKDEGLKEERLGFFSHSFFLPAMELLDRRCNMTVSFLHLKGRNFLYPIFILIVMINWSLSLPLSQLSSSSLLLSILYITTIFIVFIIIILNFVIFRNVIIITVINVQLYFCDSWNTAIHPKSPSADSLLSAARAVPGMVSQYPLPAKPLISMSGDGDPGLRSDGKVPPRKNEDRWVDHCISCKTAKMGNIL